MVTFLPQTDLRVTPKSVTGQFHVHLVGAVQSQRSTKEVIRVVGKNRVSLHPLVLGLQNLPFSPRYLSRPTKPGFQKKLMFSCRHLPLPTFQVKHTPLTGNYRYPPAHRKKTPTASRSRKVSHRIHFSTKQENCKNCQSFRPPRIRDSYAHCFESYRTC